MIVEFPWPPKEVSPNFKRANHWRKYYKQANNYRFVSKALVNAAKLREPGAWMPVSVTFYPPNDLRRDRDNIKAGFKHGLDGIADALGIDDFNFDPTYRFEAKVPGGKVVVAFEVPE